MTNKRILYLDLLRAFAVLMMVQGHTIHTFLAEEYRTFDSVFYTVWHMMRGYTAPVFMFTAGVVFTYLFYLKKLPFAENPRVKKGIKRFALLLITGYLLRYPTYKIFSLAHVSHERWLIFFSVDALHLIGFGLLTIIGLAYVAQKFKVSPYLLFGLVSGLIFIFAPIARGIEWTAFLPLPIAAYFSYDVGSLFPLVPWIGYVLCGAMLGYYISNNKAVVRSKEFGIRLLVIGSMLLFISIFFGQLEYRIFHETNLGGSSLSLVMQRVSVVLLLNSFLSFIALGLNKVPFLIVLIGRNTLSIYVVHLILLYGCAWFPGVYKYFAQSLPLMPTLGAVIVMITLMTLMVVFLDKAQIYKRFRFVYLKVGRYLRFAGNA